MTPNPAPAPGAKRRGKLPIILVLLAAAIGAGVIFGPGLLKRTGMSVLAGLDEWIARQLVAISSTYIVPAIDFKTFKYEAPYTVRLSGVTLTAPDGTKVVEAGAMIVTLAETPGLNKPLIIQNIELDDATLRLIATSDGGFKGLVPFVKGDNIKDQSKVDENVRLSNVFQIRRIKLVNGGLVYDAGDGSPPMNLSGLSLETGIEPAGGEGWYKLNIASARPPQMDLKIDGRLNLDSLEADFNALTLETRLGPDLETGLPPQIQKYIREHDVRGDMKIRVAGLVPLRDWVNSNCTASISITPLNVAFGEYRVPIDAAEFDAALKGGTLDLTKGQVNLCHGNITLSNTRVNVADASMPATAAWTIRGVELRELLRISVPEGQTPKLAGRTESNGSVTLNGKNPLATIKGSGDITIRDGRLVAIPLITELVEAMDLVGKLSGKYSLKDKADIKFDMSDKGITITQSTIETQVVAARVTGLIAWDQTLALEANAGPMEKVQSMLGEIGGLIGKVTDQLVKYRVTGVVGDPKVSVRPLGL